MQTTSFAPPTKTEINACLLHFYFGFDRSFLERVIDRAYRDLSRTLHGFANYPDRDRVRSAARECVRRAMARVDEACRCQERFDQWHRAACAQLVEHYRRSEFATFTVGHAQKWINMTVKYLALFDEGDPRQQRQLLDLGHMPIDSVMLERLSEEGLPPKLRPGKWSRIGSYADLRGLHADPDMGA